MLKYRGKCAILLFEVKSIMLILICLAVLGMAIQASFIVVEKKEKFVPAVVLKGLASCCFIALGLINFLKNPSTFSRLIFIGLICGGVGDVCLNLRLCFKDGKKVFLGGIAAFLAGHIIYLCALVPLVSAQALAIALAAGFVASALLLTWIFKNITAQKVFKIFGVFYVGAVVVMTAVSVALFIESMSAGALVYMIGAVLFTLSDIILIFNMFSEKKAAWMRPANLSLYYLGQLLIAFSLFFLNA